MKESDWKDCLESNSAIKITEDREKAESLTKIAEGRINFLEKIKITNENVNYIFEGYYTSILELLQALVLKEGYKVRNHICLGFFLRDILKEEELFRMFNDLRFKRNSLVYYGRKMEFEVGKDSIKKSKILIKDLKKSLENKN